MGSGARLEHACMKHHLNTLLILFYHIYIFICTRQCSYYASNRKAWFLSIVGLWADYWGNSWHVSPRRYKKLAHGRIFGNFFREPVQGRIFEWALLRGLPVPQGGIYPHINFERDPLNIFIVRVYGRTRRC